MNTIIFLIATIHLWNQSIENSMSSSPLGCDFVTSLKRGIHVIPKNRNHMFENMFF